MPHVASHPRSPSSFRRRTLELLERRGTRYPCTVDETLEPSRATESSTIAVPDDSTTSLKLGRTPSNAIVQRPPASVDEAWSAVLFVAEVLERASRSPSWDLADADLVFSGTVVLGRLPTLESIARETAAFRRWLHREGLGSDVGIASLDELADQAAATLASMEDLRRKVVIVERPQLAPRHERRAAERAERKQRRREAARRA